MGRNVDGGLSPPHDKMTIPNFPQYKVIHIPFFNIVRHNVSVENFIFIPTYTMFINMTKWKELVVPHIDMLDHDRVRIVLEVGGEELGVLYFEKAKRGWNKKPLTNGWTCVEAKVEGLYIYGGESVTPKELVGWCQTILNELKTGGV